MSEIPQWLCRSCGRTLDDHQQIKVGGGYLDRPLCLKQGDITNGIRRHPA